MAQAEQAGGYEPGRTAALETLLAEIARAPEQLLVRQMLVRVTEVHRRDSQTLHGAVKTCIHGAQRGAQRLSSLGATSGSESRTLGASVPGRDM